MVHLQLLRLLLQRTPSSPLSGADRYIVNSHYYAEIDPDLFTTCGSCMDERCQVKAIDEEDDVYQINERCIGCGLCVTFCPTEAIRLIHKNRENIQAPPKDMEAWNEERARQRGVDFSAYK